VTAFLKSHTKTSFAQPFAFVHAAGLMHTASLGSLDAAAGERMWQVHVHAATLLADALLPRMRAAKAGRVVLIGSRVSGGMAGRSQYAASKAALVSLCRSWAAEVIADGITVNVISPAATDTPMLKSGVRSSSAPKLPPIGRLIDPAEVAELVAYLCSPHASAITGQDIAICGGSSLPK
jgi:3-oxoacyl-[acyl-carrier protein] reductase